MYSNLYILSSDNTWELHLKLLKHRLKLLLIRFFLSIILIFDRIQFLYHFFNLTEGLLHFFLRVFLISLLLVKRVSRTNWVDCERTVFFFKDGLFVWFDFKCAYAYIFDMVYFDQWFACTHQIILSQIFFISLNNWSNQFARSFTAR
jgi:hypothetical protein